MQVEGLAELVPHVSVRIMKDCSLTKDGTIDDTLPWWKRSCSVGARSTR